MDKKCIMSIKPKYYNMIISGLKKVEYRKVVPDFSKVDNKIYFYVSNPIKNICAIAYVDEVFSSSPDEVWNQTKDIGGIDKEDFFAYCGDKQKVSAIYIKEVKNINDIILKDFYAPQNYLFRYDIELDEDNLFR